MPSEHLRLPDAEPRPVDLDPTHPWWSESSEATISALDTDSARGLSNDEAARRLTHFGPNEIRKEEAASLWSLVVHQFRDPLIYILLVAAGVTLLIRDYLDAGVILTVVLLNALIGFIQEARARKAMQALARLGAPKAEVIREGVASAIPAEALVPGDLVRLTSGARVPADLRLLRAVDLEIDEAPLTGESLPVRKDPAAHVEGTPVAGDQVNLAFAGTMVSRGRGRGVVVRTGATTEVGRIAEAVRGAAGVRTPLQDKVHAFGARVGWVLLALALVASGLGVLRGLTWTEIFLTAVAMAVSAVPEGLPVVLTVTLAVGARRMAARNAILRKLPAVEALGSTTVIASDKTGTLTRNEMTVRRVWTGGAFFEVEGTGYAREGTIRPEGRAVEGATGEGATGPVALRTALLETLRAGILAGEADPRITDVDGAPLGDPTEVALLVAGVKGGLDPEAERTAFPEIDVLPFEPERALMGVLVAPPTAGHAPSANLSYWKGAPEALLARSSTLAAAGGEPTSIDEKTRQGVREAAHALAADGLRVLAMARSGPSLTSDANDWTFLGLQGMEDPVRPEAIDSVAAVQGAGIRVLMLTGDHLTTAQTIGARLGLGQRTPRAMEGRELAELDDAALDQALDEGVEIFARVAPEHKLRIVERLRARGEIVAVTGDGVNDAPALRAAHLGIAMGRSGTDVAREAADMVLQDDNFATIRAAVEEGRVVFANIRKVTFFLLSTAVGEVITILVALALGWPLPFVAAQILWINLVTNGLQDVALAFEPGEPGLLRKKPRPTNEGILPFRLMERLGAVGVLLATGTLWTFWWALESTGDLDAARTAAMTQMVVFQFFHVFNCRSLDRSIFKVPLFSNPFLFGSLIAAVGAQLAVLYWGPLQRVFRTVPLSWDDWSVILLIGSTVIVGAELDKVWQRRRNHELS